MPATLLISSKNYSSWSLRGFLLTRLSGLQFEERAVDPNHPATKAELLLQSASIRIPCLTHDGIEVWDTLPAMFGAPTVRHADWDDESGRGLKMIEMLSEDWGWETVPGWSGKRVWAIIQIPK